MPRAGQLTPCQCDETQPVCKRCVKSGRECLGMREPGSVVHIENSYASGKKKRPRGPRSTFTVQTFGYSEPAAPQPALVDLRTEATGYYFNTHLQTLPDALNITKSMPDDFLQIWMSRPENRILSLALSSMALAVFSRKRRSEQAALEASNNYQQLLRTTQHSIVYLDEKNIDVWLLAIFFMSRYEQVVHRPGPHPNGSFRILKSFSHHDGAMAILRTWKDRLSYIHPPTNIIKHTRRAMVRSALLRTQALPGWLQDGAVFGEEGLELQYDQINVRIANLRHQVSLLVKTTSNSQKTSRQVSSPVETLVDEARDIEKAFQAWNSNFPTTWSKQRHTLPDLSLPTKDFYSPTVLTCSTLAYGAVWNSSYAIGMLLNSTRLKILSLCRAPDPFTDDERLECLSSLQTMANDLTSSIPFSLRTFQVTSDLSLFSPQSSPDTDEDDVQPCMAGVVVWPLSIASSLDELDSEQRSWFRSTLTRLGKVMGDSVLENEADKWFVL